MFTDMNLVADSECPKCGGTGLPAMDLTTVRGGDLTTAKLKVTPGASKSDDELLHQSLCTCVRSQGPLEGG